MSDYVLKSIGSGIELLSCPADRFKTNETAIILTTPLCRETASVNALVSNLLCRSSNKYPDITALNKKLAMLYGAAILPTITKIGACQVIRIGMTCIDDRFALEDESISQQCLELLLSLLFDPKLNESGLFDEQSVETEKRILKEKIEAEENEKRTFALRRTEEIMFANEPYGINRYGSIDDINKITPQSATAAWRNMLMHSKVLITMVGGADTQAASSAVDNMFSKISRDYQPPEKAIIKEKADDIKEVTDKLDVKQGKLVLGFRVNLDPSDKLTAAMRSFADIFGGGPYSKLFTNVREKMSLCYYCSARYNRNSGCILVQCGCEEDNMDKAVKEISAQLQSIKNGDCESELESSKMAITDSLMSVYDAPDALEAWYMAFVIDKKFKTPLESAAENKAVTKDDIIKCASLVSLDTIYKLTSNGEENE